MSWNEAYAQERRAALEPVDSEIRRLPAAMREQGRLLAAELLAASGADNLTGVFSGPHDYPALHLHEWVLEGWPAPPSISPRVFTRAAFFTAAARRLAEAIDDPDSLTTDSARPLLDYLRDRAVSVFKNRFVAGSPILGYVEEAWSQFDSGDDLLAPHKLPSLGAAVAARRANGLAHLDRFLDRINALYRTVFRLRSLRPDLQAGRLNPTVAALLEANDIPADEPDWPARLMGALVVSDALSEPVRSAQADLATAREISVELGLGGFGTYLNYLDHSLDRVRSLFKAGGNSRKAASPGDGFLLPAIDTPRLALEAAESYLLSDLTFRESWEVHRYGLFGKEEVTSRFPAGLALEILCETGHPLTRTVDAFLDYLAEHHFSYFDDREIVLRDADTLGLALRLWPYGSRPEGLVRDRLEAALEIMEQSVNLDGRIPVWLEKPPPGVRLTGEGCGVVEAHLLLGLIAFDSRRYEEVIARSASGLLSRFARLGVEVSVNYPGLHALGVLLRLAAGLAEAGVTASGPKTGDFSFRQALFNELDRPSFSNQEAAFAILAFAHPGFEDFRWSGFPVRVRKSQRSDGSWNAEPFCFTANRGNQASPYSSRTLTTAFCYRALHAAKAVAFNHAEAPEALLRHLD